MSKKPKPLIERLPPSMKTPLAKFVGGSILVTGILGGIFWANSQDKPLKTQEVSFTKFKQLVDEKKFASVNATKDQATGQITYKGHSFKDGKSFIAYDFPDKDMASAIERSGGVADAKKIEAPAWWQGALIFLIPTALLIGFFIWQGRRQSKNQAQMMGGTQGGAMAFGKSKAKLMQDESASNVRFSDVAGADEAKLEVAEIVEFLKDPNKFRKMGSIVPNGLLLAGGPGLGKTLLAKAIAGEAKVPFFSISGSAFVEMFVGVGAARVRDMFEQAKKHAPCIIFVDEIDAMAKKRGGANPNDERESTLNQMLVEMDGFEPNLGVIVMAATNRPELLDDAIMRPGRFSRQVTLHPYDLKGRMEILQVHARKMNKIAGRRVFGNSIDFKNIARAVAGFSGADLANLLNEAGICAVRRNAKFIHFMDVLEAKDKIQMGFKRKGLVSDPLEMDKVACHEAGHAICAYLLQKILKGKVDKITVVPRSRSLGHTSFLSDDDQFCYSREQLKARLIYMLGGRVAELIHFNETSTGAGNDLERVTKTAREMIMQYGMSDDLAPRNYLPDVSRGIPIPTMSEHQAKLVDDEINRLIKEVHTETWRLIEEHAEEFKLLWSGVKEFETLEMEDVEVLMKEKSMDRLREVRTARETAMQESVNGEMAEEELTAPSDDPPKGVAKGDLWNYTPR